MSGPTTLLGFDVGARRIGVAVGNTVSGSARELGVLDVHAAGPDWPRLDRWVAEWRPDALVVGVPFHPDGASHDNTARARKFARQLRGRCGKPVYEVDERYSTTEARSGGARDAAAGAACVILEQFLRSLP